MILLCMISLCGYMLDNVISASSTPEMNDFNRNRGYKLKVYW